MDRFVDQGSCNKEGTREGKVLKSKTGAVLKDLAALHIECKARRWQQQTIAKDKLQQASHLTSGP